MKWLGPILILALSGTLFFHGLASRDVWGSHEARAGQNAASMLHYGDWSLPRLTDERADLQKPPMYYWLVAAIARIRGADVDVWAIRLPSAIAALLCTLLVYAGLAWRGRPTAGLIAAIMLATMQHFTWLGRTARIDMPLTLCVTMAIVGTLWLPRTKLIAVLALACGILLKGPIGLVLPVAVLTAHTRLNRQLPDRPISLRGIALMALAAIGIALPWFVLAQWETKGEFFRVFFWYHNVQRAMGGAQELAVHPWWYYGPRLLVDAVPWAVLLVPAFVWLSRGAWRADADARLGLLWLAVIVAVLSCAKFKRADYLLPAYPGLAILLGCACESWWRSTAPLLRSFALGAGGITVASVVAAWGFLIHDYYPRSEHHREQRSFAQRVREIAPAPRPILFFRVEAHALAFHLGRPINTFLEWENLDVWAANREPHYVLMDPKTAKQWQVHLSAGTLEEVARNFETPGDHERPLVLMRTRAKAVNPDAVTGKESRDQSRPDQHGVAGAQSGGPGGASAAGVGDRFGPAPSAIRNPGSG